MIKDKMIFAARENWKLETGNLKLDFLKRDFANLCALALNN
jgi:hypothetical protein